MQSLSSREKQNLQFETVLILQGGGSLGAYECGVYKALYRHGIKFDIVAGTSIGAVNASIITGSRSDDPAKALEEFWLDLAEGVTSSSACLTRYDHTLHQCILQFLETPKCSFQNGLFQVQIILCRIFGNTFTT